MLDHRALLNDSDTVLAALRHRGVGAQALDGLVQLLKERRRLIGDVEGQRHELKQATTALQKQAQGEQADALEQKREQLRQLKQSIKDSEAKHKQVEDRLFAELLELPNLPHDSVPEGADESANRVERVHGEVPRFAFNPKPHWEIAEALGIVSFEQAARVSGSRFAVYRGAGARLERALISFMLDMARDNGYEEILPPYLVRPETMVASGQYPKFVGESFETLNREYVLIPTAEVPLVALHRDEILTQEVLPLRYCAYTACFRREAGAAGKDTRGLIRLHQFNKVELVVYTTAEESDRELERLTGNAEQILRRLELPYRVVSLCTGDLGFASSKTYDLEVYLPGQNGYREISSCSNCTDFQARRAQIRYRPADKGKKAKPTLVHTLNGSGLAVGRTLVAILENCQQADGSLTIPEALVPYLGEERLGP